eukprot:CAMPEP_0178449958 /NCGR_PEP_ID=MMETSP0689_2-20121128/42849_1 /TAXON_ID=160604 /ORGANISM="Amphidinium massartii, Strain CS-259" /LENGTH=44 /DNA_ID= /DNA_START= /DNA_END= /DNA_ORIENTATION=
MGGSVSERGASREAAVPLTRALPQGSPSEVELCPVAAASAPIAG